MKRRKYGNNTAPILSVLTPYRSSLTTKTTTKGDAIRKTGCKRRGDQQGSDSTSIRGRKRSRLSNSVSQSSDSDQDVRRELGLTNQITAGGSDQEGENILFLDDGYQVG